MHGRLKVKTSAEQAEAKRKEKEKKAKAYLSATQEFLTKHHAREYEDAVLKMCASILEMNPDFSTGWNFRKEAFLQALEVKSPEEIENQVKVELSLAEACLRTQPKSYCAWMHRIWVLQHSPQPDWEAELALCDAALKLDERNFHCWDHRRVVCQEANVDPKKELEFTAAKIRANFSNHSAWHYRSKLLTILHPTLPSNICHEELEQVQNAVFTDPSDQSAWMYLRWLMGAGKPDSKKYVYIPRFHIGDNEVIVLFSSPIQAKDFQTDVLLTKNSQPLAENLKWTPVSNEPCSTLWHASLDPLQEGDSLTVTYIPSQASKTCTRGEQDNACPSSENRGLANWHAWLEEHLSLCQQLLELEPDSKYALLTAVELMELLDMPSASIVNLLTQLKNIDPGRNSYYDDKISLVKLKEIAHHNIAQESLSLISLDLTLLGHTHLLFDLKVLDITGNKVISLWPLRFLLHLEVLTADDNYIKSTQGLEGLSHLKEAHLKRNCISSVEALSHLESIPSLMLVTLEGNPLVREEQGWEDTLCRMLAKAKIDILQASPGNQQ